MCWGSLTRGGMLVSVLHLEWNGDISVDCTFVISESSLSDIYTVLELNWSVYEEHLMKPNPLGNIAKSESMSIACIIAWAQIPKLHKCYIQKTELWLNHLFKYFLNWWAEIKYFFEENFRVAFIPFKSSVTNEKKLVQNHIRQGLFN